MPYAVIRCVATGLVVLAAVAGCVPSKSESGEEDSAQAFERSREVLSKPTVVASVVRPGDDGHEAIRANVSAPEFTFEFRLYQRPGMDPSVPAVYEKVASGDFNGDGRADLVFGMASNEIELVFQNANGGFSAPIIYGTGNEVYSSFGFLVVGDFNKDGLDDIVFDTVGEHGEQGGVAILRSRNGAAPEFRQLHQPILFTSGSGPHGWDAVDIDGDDKLDLIALHNGPADLADLGLWDAVDFSCEWNEPCLHYLVYYGDGQGGLEEPEAIKVDGLPDQRFLGDFFVDDIDGDERNEILFSLVDGSGSHDALYVAKLPIRATVSRPTLLHPKVSDAPLFFGDIDGDGVKDTIHGNAVFRGGMDGGFSGPYGLAIYYFMESPWNVLADFDGNGYVDVVNHQFRYFGEIPYFVTYLQRNGGLQAPFFLYDPPTTHFVKSHAERQATAVGDFNSDGCRDIAMAIGYSGVLLLDGKNCIVRLMRTGGRLPARRKSD